MARFERDNWASVAHAEIIRRVRESDAHAEALALVIDGVADDIRGADVAMMRALGGFDAIIKRRIAALNERFSADLGSKLIPMSVVSVIRMCSLQDIRLAAINRNT